MKPKSLLRHTAIGLIGALGITAGSAYFLFRGSLPLVEGECYVEGLSGSIEILRDSRGIPSILAANREDLSLALGYLHGQERFFQIDLMRRAAAGELSELFGTPTLEFDKERRRHQLRKVARETLSGLTERERRWLEAYAKGVNQGVKALRSHPFEYYLIGAKPLSWKPEDSILVGLSLFFELQDPKAKFDIARGVISSTLPQEVSRFFTQNGSSWEALLDGTKTEIVPLPDADHFQYLKPGNSLAEEADSHLKMAGSNQWAATGSRTSDGRAILACDMHLNLSVPNIWYRASFYYYEDSEPVEAHGATLPGTPLMAIGSNRFVAWGFTNSYIDTSDVVAGSDLPFRKEKEWIHVKGEPPVPFEIEVTPFGPLLADPYFNEPAALLWVAHIPGALNMLLADLETAHSASEALEKAKEIRTPLLNLMVADDKGHIGWTLVGAIPERCGFDGRIPIKADQASLGWNGFVDPSHYPVVYDPPEGILVTANNKLLGRAWDEKLGYCGFLNGIRAYQITHRLKEARSLDENAMLKIQLDDEALFFFRWKELLLDLLKTSSESSNRRRELLEILSKWDGRCSENSEAFYWIRSFRTLVAKRVLSRLLQPCLESCQSFDFITLDFEEPLWMVVSQKPAYLASSAYDTWNDELNAYIDDLIGGVPENRQLREMKWGQHNTLQINHPLSGAFVFSDRLLNMAHDQVSGDFWVPRVAGPDVGASQRMVVSPGREEEAIFHSPGGQSGHPLSPHYADGHQAWLQGLPESLLPGKKVTILKLMPYGLE